MVTVVPRRVGHIGARFADWRWEDTVIDLPEGRWQDALTGASHPAGTARIAELLATFPTAILTRTA